MRGGKINVGCRGKEKDDTQRGVAQGYLGAGKIFFTCWWAVAGQGEKIAEGGKGVREGGRRVEVREKKEK